ncbi:MAG: uracil-DNA glycosylase family protein [Brevinemataceae bacterium]
MNNALAIEEHHPLHPFLPENAQALLLGSFPPKQEKWCMEFYYPNFQNDMWRIFGLMFFQDKNYFIDTKQKSFNKEKIIQFLSQQGIAIGDSAQKIRRLKNNASDKFLEILEPLNIRKVLEQLPSCHSIIVTGEKAAEIVSLTLHLPNQPTIQQPVSFNFNGNNISLYRVPSSSKAYPLSIEDKTSAYKKVFSSIFDLP